MRRAVDPTELTPLQVRRRLRAWAAGMDAHVHAAVELLISHDVWLRRPEFITAAMCVREPAIVWLNWQAARTAFDAGRFNHARSTERAVLDLAIALGENRYRLPAIGARNAAAIATALALATGLVTPAPKGTRTP